jgi:ribosomal protein L24E
MITKNIKNLTCDYCNKPHKRKRFCSNKCKDKYHNLNNPRGLGIIQTETEHPFSQEALGQF